MMQVKVRLFASLRETLGYSERDLEVTDGFTLHDVWKLVSENKDPETEVMMAINMDYAQPDVKVKDGDEVAFFPPVTGG